MEDYLIRELSQADLPALKTFAPPEWNTDLSETFFFHYGQPYFYPVGCELNGKLVGCANALLQGNTGWFGNIIVLPEYRRRGIGRALIHHLAAFFDGTGITQQVLIATQLGEPVYRTEGFRVVSQYVFLKPATLPAPRIEAGCRLMQPQDEPAMLALDEASTGEQRPAFLRRYWADAWVHTSPAGMIDGFYLPRLAHGPVIAANDTGGQALLKVKMSLGLGAMVVPEQNHAALQFLTAHGFVETARSPRMARGADAPWRPEQVFARGSGFCG